MNISFGSTYRILITQPGANNAKKERLRNLATEYQGLVSSSKTGTARVSIPNELDEDFEKKLKNIGYKQYQKFEAENLPTDQIDSYIKANLDDRTYEQHGKQKKGQRKTKQLYC